MSRLGTQRQFVQYHQKVLSYDPIAYWPLDEKQGTVAYDWVSGRVAGAQNGAYTGVTLGQPGIGDGRTSPLFDGANDYVNVYSTTFRDAFNGAEGTLMAWAKVSGVGVWTDTVLRYISAIYIDASNYVLVRKATVANKLEWIYVAGGINETVSKTPISETGWMCLGLTWSKTADKMIVYYNGVQEGVTQTGLGTWAGNPAAAYTCIGSLNTTPLYTWNGYEAHVAVFGSALPPAAMLDLATV